MAPNAVKVAQDLANNLNPDLTTMEPKRRAENTVLWIMKDSDEYQGGIMKQRYAFIAFFLTLIIYHITHGCPTCVTQKEAYPKMWKSEVYLAAREQLPTGQKSTIMNRFDPAFTGA